MTWKRKVSQHNSRSTLTSNEPCIHGRVRALQWQQLVAQAMQYFKGAIGRFRDAMNVQQSKAAMKRQRGKKVLLKDVRECPIAISLNQAACLKNRFDDKRGGIGIIVHRIA